MADGFLPLRSDYLTAACLWHTQDVLARGVRWLVGGYTSMGPEKIPTARRLRVE